MNKSKNKKRELEEEREMHHSMLGYERVSVTQIVIDLVTKSL